MPGDPSHPYSELMSELITGFKRLLLGVLVVVALSGIPGVTQGSMAQGVAIELSDVELLGCESVTLACPADEGLPQVDPPASQQLSQSLSQAILMGPTWPEPPETIETIETIATIDIPDPQLSQEPLSQELGSPVLAAKGDLEQQDQLVNSSTGEFIPNPDEPNSDNPGPDSTKQDPQAERVYTRLDAMTILLREGMESLLVITALLAFLNRSGHADKSFWIWLGAGGGILASIGTAVAIRVLFRSVLGDVDPDLLEGVTGLVAAGLLLYVSLWLHRQSSAGAWKRYIEEQTASVLQASTLLPLALIAFLAVYREGAETILLYVGMAPSISSADLWSGLGMGSALLVLIAVLMLGLGLRIPLRPFFRGTSLLIYLLGFKFVGNGIHNLQEVGRLPIHVAESLPTLKKLGIYPTWETALTQLALLGITIVLIVWIQRQSGSQQSAA